MEIEFGTGWCNTPHTLETIVYTFADYVQTAYVPSYDCAVPHAVTAPDALNHVEVYLTQKHIEVWTSDASSDGVNFPNLHLMWEGDLDLPFGRGYVSLALRNHATMKYWLGSAALVRWDNIGFDGPPASASGYHDYSAPDSLTAYHTLSGCKMDGDSCQWQGDVIAQFPDDAGRGENAPRPLVTMRAKAATWATRCPTRTRPRRPCRSTSAASVWPTPHARA